MNEKIDRVLRSLTASLALAMLTGLVTAAQVSAQCDEIVSGLREPLGIALSNQGNLLVSETGTTTLHSGRISIVDREGNRRTLLDGLPSAINDVSEPSGPHGLFMRGRTLYVAIGTGDAGRPGPFPGTTIPNPDGVSSPIFSSILAVHFSVPVERNTTGFTLTAEDQQALADGETVGMSGNAGGIKIKLIANFPDYVPFPIPPFPDNVQLSNPFQLVAVEDNLYVTDGGRNLTWKIDLLTHDFSELVSFPPIPNPAFPEVGGPTLDAVPTGIASNGDQLLVTLFRGFPFPPNVSTIEQVDPVTGNSTSYIMGLRTAIAVLPMTGNQGSGLLVLQHNSGTTLLPPWSGPGVLLRFDTPSGPPTVLADCFTRPTAMTLDRRTSTLYVSEFGGRVVSVDIGEQADRLTGGHRDIGE